MGARKQPTPVPTNQVKPAPPPAPPPKRDDFSYELRCAGRPPKPPEPQLRIMKEGHIPPRWQDGPIPPFAPPAPREHSTTWLWFIFISAISFLLGVGFAEWTR